MSWRVILFVSLCLVTTLAEIKPTSHQFTCYNKLYTTNSNNFQRSRNCFSNYQRPLDSKTSTTTSTRFSVSFWRENLVAVVTVLRVLARMSKWRKQVIKCEKFYHFTMGRRCNLSSSYCATLERERERRKLWNGEGRYS